MTQRHEQLEQLSAYLDGELGEAERRDIEALVGRDPEARNLLEGLRQTSELLGSLPRGTAPPDLATSVTARLERHELLGDSAGPWTGKAGRRVAWTSRLAVAASIGLVCTAGWLGWDRMSEMGDTPALVERTDAPPESSIGPTDHLVNGNAAAPAENAVVSTVQPLSDATESDSSRLGMEVHKKTATLRAGLDRAAPGLTDMPVQNGFEESAPTVTVPAFAKDDFETRLATHTLSNDVLQRVPFGTVSNTVEVLSNESTQQAMAKAVTTFASKNRLPIVGIQRLAEPISPSQAFVVRGEPEMNYRPMADQNEEVYLLNMPQEDLEALLLEVQDAAGESAGTLRVVANGQAVKDLNDAGNVVVMAPRRRTLGYAMNGPARDASIKLSFDESMGRELAASEIELTDSAYEADARDDDESDLKRETDPVKPLKKAVRSSEEDELRFKDRGVDKSQPADGAALAKKGSKPDDSNRPAPAKREGFEKSIVGGRRAGSTKTVDAKHGGELGKQSTAKRRAPTSFGWVGGGAANRQFVAFTLSLRAARGAPSGTASSPSGAKASKLVPSSGPTTQTTQPTTGRPTSVEPSRGG